jgi:DNA primase (bacterial type)
MASRFREFVEEVRAASDLVEVIQADVQLNPSGRTLKGLSPFHQEKHPSFVVWPDNQSWHDFSNGGGLGGDVFAYLQHRDQISFKEAVFALAERKGIRRPDQDEEAFRKELALLVERRDVERLLTQAAAYFHQVLPSRVREEWYREHYGFSDETIDRLQLGWADGHLFEHFTETLKIDRGLALKTGLFVRVGRGKVEDFFTDRLGLPPTGAAARSPTSSPAPRSTRATRPGSGPSTRSCSPTPSATATSRRPSATTPSTTRTRPAAPSRS